MILDVISFISRFAMALVWLVAGFTKLGERVAEAQAIRAYDIFGATWSNYLSYLIAPLEIAGGVLLLFGIFLRHSSLVSTFVLVLFIIGIAQAWQRGLVIDCGCFGPKDADPGVGMDYALTIARDVLFIFFSLWTYYRPFKKFAIYA
ncbi:DoxX family protein [Corynebacterium sp. sy017]|nr:DoxX family protein [Corynebacterium sp. sy017]MBP3088140.1 DoxX family protein [Corynebacterium sp. sy017]QDZ43596.1 DoxX family protein [Corynebacterium sp. sy039]TSD92770.1 DoxX family protein [Corynebacterium sp. SY003]